MKAPSINWKIKAAILSVVFLVGAFIGQAPFREVMQADDANMVSAYWLLNKVKMSGVAASIRQSNELKFSANGWKVLDGGMQIAQAPKP
jgi:hypothetical protein